jgi:hypothetical protein
MEIWVIRVMTYSALFKFILNSYTLFWLIYEYQTFYIHVYLFTITSDSEGLVWNFGSDVTYSVIGFL